VQRKSEVKVTLCQRAPRYPAWPSLITFQFHPFVVSLEIGHSAGTYFLALKIKVLTWYIVAIDGHSLSTDQNWEWIVSIVWCMHFTYFHRIVHQIIM